MTLSTLGSGRHEIECFDNWVRVDCEEHRSRECTKLGENLGCQMDEAKVELRVGSENDLLCDWRTKQIEDIAYCR